MTYLCDVCPLGKGEETCVFYTDLLEKCDFPKIHDREREREYLSRGKEWLTKA